METIQVPRSTDLEVARVRARKRLNKKIDQIFGLSVVVGVLLTGSWMVGSCAVKVAYGSPEECQLIKDADKRNFCRAEAYHRRSYCDLIKDNDMRHRCRAIVTEKKK